MTAIEVVERYFAAMQGGQAEADALFSLFADDAVYVEPFSGAGDGKVLSHRGLAAIRACFEANWSKSPPALSLEVNRIDVDGPVVRSEWTCRSPAFDEPVRGVDVCTVRDGRIERLEVRFA